MADHPASHRSVTRRRRGGSAFGSNKLTLRQRIVAAERLAKIEDISTPEALKRINKAQKEREQRIKKRK